MKWRYVINPYFEERKEVDHKTYESPGYYDNMYLIDEKNEVVAGCGEYNVFGTYEHRCLLKAAPELLEALILILPLAKGYAKENSFRINNEVIEQAEKAIGNAEGKV